MSPRKNNRPSLEEYFGLEAAAYGNSQWMARNQIRTTERALELLQASYFKFPLLFERGEFASVLDIGCGTGYSSHTLLESFGRVVGVDFSRDMLGLCPRDPRLHLIQGDLRALPFRNALFFASISISAFNFASAGSKSPGEIREKIRRAISSLEFIAPIGARVVIEFYPTPAEEAIFMQVLKEFAFTGGILRDDPNTKKEKIFLLLERVAT